MAPAKKENLLLSSSFPSVNTPERFQKSKPAPCAAPKDVKVSPAISQRNVDIVDQKLSSSIPKERPDEIFRWTFFFLEEAIFGMIVILIQATLSIWP